MPGRPDTCSVATWVEANEPREPMTETKDSREPESPGQSPMAAQGSSAPELRPRPSLLLIEDDDEIRSSLEDVLSDFGYAVRAEPSADAALPILHQYLPDAIVTDVRMPGLSGIDFCKRLTGDGPHAPVIVMTAF